MTEPTATSFDLYVWRGPRDLDGEAARALVEGWLAAGGDPSSSPFEPSSDVGWFFRELRGEYPALDAVTDAVPTGKAPIWASATNEPPARVVAVRLSREAPRGELESILGLATKYDLMVFEPRQGVVRRPMADLAALANAVFWPRGAIRAATAGVAGLVLAVLSWLAGIPILSGIGVVIGGFLFVMAVFTFVYEGRVTLRNRRERRTPR